LRNELNANQGENVGLQLRNSTIAAFTMAVYSGVGSNSRSRSLDCHLAGVLFVCFCSPFPHLRCQNFNENLIERRRPTGEKTEAAVPLPDKNVCVFGEQRVLKIYGRRQGCEELQSVIANEWRPNGAHKTHNTQRSMLTHVPAVCFRTLDLPSEVMHLPMFSFNYAGKLPVRIS
jgi:hypothetical protein